MPFTDKPAFRCKACGHLEAAEHAGEHDLPHACSVCGSGVCLSPRTKALADELASPNCTAERRMAIAAQLGKIQSGTEAKEFDPANWEVLADCTPDRLKELGLKECARHKGAKGAPQAGASVHVAASG